MIADGDLLQLAMREDEDTELITISAVNTYIENDT